MQCLLLGKIRFFAHSGSCARSSLTNKLLAGWRQIADSVLCAFQIGSHCFCKPCCAVWCVTDEWWVICQLAEDSLCSSGIVIALHWSKFQVRQGQPDSASCAFACWFFNGHWHWKSFYSNLHMSFLSLVCVSLCFGSLFRHISLAYSTLGWIITSNKALQTKL